MVRYAQSILAVNMGEQKMIARIGTEQIYCNTDTATKIVSWTAGTAADKDIERYTLYVNRNGKFFIHVSYDVNSGHAKRKYGIPKPGEAILETNAAEVEHIIDRYMEKSEARKIKNAYLWPIPEPLPDDGARPKALSVRLSPKAYSVLKSYSEKKGASLSKCIEGLILEHAQ